LLTVALVHKKLNEIIASRGKKGTKPKDLMRQLESLAKMSIQFGPRTEIPVLMHLISAQFDLQRSIDEYMDTAMWRFSAASLGRVADFCKTNPDMRLVLMTADDISDMIISSQKEQSAAKIKGTPDADEVLINPTSGEVETAAERVERLRAEEDSKLSADERNKIKVAGSMAVFMHRLEEEYVKSLQKTNPHTPEYVDRLKDEGVLLDVLSGVQHYFEKTSATSEVAELSLLRLEHMYYKHDTIAVSVVKATKFNKLYVRERV